MTHATANSLIISIYFATLCMLHVGSISSAAPSPEPVVFNPTTGNAYNSGFISNPSIYTYTIENQQQEPINKTQQAPAYYNNYNTNYYHTSSAGSNSNTASNRNFYFANNYQSKEASTATTAAEPTQSAPAAALNGCSLDRLAVYKVVLHTYWTRELFPKHYPDWRPSAQWTKTLGRTHDSSYAIYHIGQKATPGVKQFTETGKSDILDSILGEQQQLQMQQQKLQQKSSTATGNAGNSFTSFVSTSATGSGVVAGASNQQQQKPSNERSVFDEFNIPAISNGAGRNEAKFFVDSNHSLVSLMTRIVPSPDWFIGIDSFQLCVGGSWIDSITVELDPFDAGTDNGFTFTAPNWPTNPQGVIYRITSRYPAHPAGSFFYPKNKRLPPIATFQFIKLKEYELSEVFNFSEDERKYETVKTQTHLEMEHNHIEMNNELSASIELERQNEIPLQPSTLTERDRIRSKLLAKMNPMQYNNSIIVSGNIVPKNDKNALMQNIAKSYQKQRSESAAATSTALLVAKRRRAKAARDCRVSHWSNWTPCSKTCGIGEMHRYRKVIKHGKRGGRPCPALQESKWCGSEKGCHPPESYFNWSNT